VGISTNPVIQVSPNSVSFGSVAVGTASNMSVAVQNLGGGTLAGTATVSAPFSVIAGGTYSLGANQSQTVTVRFSPTATGSTNGSVIFTGGGGATVPVSGRGASVNNRPPTVSPIAKDTPDVDPNVAGLQVYEGTVAQYSGSASDPDGDPLSWQWIYTVNGGGETVLSSGSGTVTPVSFSYGTGSEGNTYVWKLRVSDGSVASESTLSVGVPRPSSSIPFQAGAGAISAPFISATGGISQASLSGVTDGGRAVYSFTLTSNGNYVIQALVSAPSLTENSFYLNIDAEPQDPAMTWDILPVTAGIEERFVSWRGSGTAETNQFVPKLFQLTAGTHQLIIRGREPNAVLKGFSLQVAPGKNLRVLGGF
jgi:hypothetical protein